MRRAVSQAFVDQLMAATNATSPGLALAANECGLAPIGGRPPAIMGEKYVGVRTGSRQTDRVTAGLSENYSVIVTITMRAARVAFDRLGQELMNEVSNGFDDFADAVRLCLHGDLIDGRIVRRCNAIIQASSTGGGLFSEAFEFLGDDDPYPVDGPWFHAGEGKECGIVQNLRFGLGKRHQRAGSLEGIG